MGDFVPNTEEYWQARIAKSIESLATLVSGGRLPVNAGGVTLTCDQVDLDVFGITGGEGGEPGVGGKTLKDIYTILGLIRTACEALRVAKTIDDVETAVKALRATSTLDTVQTAVENLQGPANKTTDDIVSAVNALRTAKTLDDIEAAVKALRATSTLDTVQSVLENIDVSLFGVQTAVQNLQGTDNKTFTDLATLLGAVKTASETLAGLIDSGRLPVQHAGDGDGLAFSTVSVTQAAPGIIDLGYEEGKIIRLHALTGTLDGAGTVAIKSDEDGAGTNAVALSGPMALTDQSGLVIPFTPDPRGCPATLAGKHLTLISTIGKFSGYAVISKSSV